MLTHDFSKLEERVAALTTTAQCTPLIKHSPTLRAQWKHINFLQHYGSSRKISNVDMARDS